MTTIISRRGFLRIGCCSVAALGLTGLAGKLGLMSAIAEGATPYQALVCIFLLGGSDSNNVLIPTDSRYAQYQQIRAVSADTGKPGARRTVAIADRGIRWHALRAASELS